MIRKKTNSHKKLWLGGLVILVAGALVGTVWAWHQHTVTSKRVTMTTATRTTPPSMPAQAPNTVVPNPTPTPTSNVPGGTTGSNVGSTASLTAPSGTFVNNHGGDSAYPVTTSTSEISNCTTTPGATCDIQFTNTQSGVTKTLGTKTTPTTAGNLPAGSVSWSWTPGSIGLTSGTWKITAIATLGGQTKTTTDSLNLTIQ